MTQDYSTEANSVKNALDVVYLQKTSVVDSLSSTSTTSPLSAKQGKELNDKIGAIVEFFNGDRISLTSNKDVLSYVDDDNCVLTATINSFDSIGRTVKLYIQKGLTPNTVSDTYVGQMTDNNDGTYSFTYTSTGSGDLKFYAVVGNAFSDNYVVQDIYKYVTSFTNWISDSDKGVMFSDFELPSDYSWEMKLNDANTCAVLGDNIQRDSDGYYYWVYAWYIGDKLLYTCTSDWNIVSDNLTYTIDTSIPVRLEHQGNSIKLYVNDTLIDTYSTYNLHNLDKMFRLPLDDDAKVDWIKVREIGINLSSTNNVLSYVDNDDTTITATVIHPNNTDKSITFVAKDSNNNTIDTYSTTTDSSGQASYVYDSQGVGDVTITVSCIDLSETYTITDARYYDASSSSNLSKYSTNASMTYDSTEQAYLLTTGTSQDYQWKKTTLNNLVFPYNCTIRAKIKLTDDDSNNQFCIGLQNNHVVVGFTTIADTIRWILVSEQDNSISTNYKEDKVNLNSSTLTLNTWYTVELIYTSTTATFKLYNGSTLLATASLNTTALDSTTNSLIFFTGMRPNVKQYVKDIIVL